MLGLNWSNMLFSEEMRHREAQLHLSLPGSAEPQVNIHHSHADGSL